MYSLQQLAELGYITLELNVGEEGGEVFAVPTGKGKISITEQTGNVTEFVQCEGWPNEIWLWVKQPNTSDDDIFECGIPQNNGFNINTVLPFVIS